MIVNGIRQARKTIVGRRTKATFRGTFSIVAIVGFVVVVVVVVFLVEVVILDVVVVDIFVVVALLCVANGNCFFLIFLLPRRSVPLVVVVVGVDIFLAAGWLE